MSEPENETLSPNPTATLLFDGVLFFCYDRPPAGKKIVQAGVHVNATGHDLYIRIDIKHQEDAGQLIKLTHPEVAAQAPFYLYVTDDPRVKPPVHGKAVLFQENNLRFPQSFGYVLDLQSEEFYKRDLELKPGIFAPINMLDGTFYSAELSNAKRQIVREENDEPIGQVASLIAADIADEGRYLVLKDKDLNNVFEPLPLSLDTIYEIQIVNSPSPPGPRHQSEQPSGIHHPKVQNSHAGHNHFFEYYKAFSLKHGEKQYYVEQDEIGPKGVDDPPCLSPRGSQTSSLPAWESPFDSDAEVVEEKAPA